MSKVTRPLLRKTVERNKAKLEKKILGVLQQIEEGIAQDNSEEQASEPVALDSASLQGIVEKINAENAKMPESTKEEKQAKREREKVARELGKMQEKQAADRAGSRLRSDEIQQAVQAVQTPGHGQGQYGLWSLRHCLQYPKIRPDDGVRRSKRQFR